MKVSEILCDGKKRSMNLEEIVEHRNTVTKALSELKIEGMFAYQLWNDYVKFFNEQIKCYYTNKRQAEKLMVEYKRISPVKEAS
ncbi:MAG: hypothetical protein ACOCQG_00635 [Candidatus Nanoarchaeia archaeon]